MKDILIGLALATAPVAAAYADDAGDATGAAASATAPSLSVSYSGSVLIFPVADISLSAVFPQGTYASAARFTTAGVARWFDDTDIEAGVTGYREPEGLRPWRYEHFNHASGSDRTVGIDFPDATATPDVDPPFGSMGQPPASETERAGALDPLSTLIGIMTAVAGGEGAAEEPCTGRLPVFDGKARYDLRLEQNGRDRVRAGDWRGEAIVCDAYVEPISGYDPGDRPSPEEIAEPVTLWLAPIEGLFVPVRFRASSEIGPINIRARRIQVD